MLKSNFTIALLCIFFLSPLNVKGAKIEVPEKEVFVETIAGTGKAGFKDGKQKGSEFSWPTGLAVKEDNTIYVADYGNNAIRKIKNKQVSTVAGNGKRGFLDGSVKNALFFGPDNIAMDKDGNIIVGDADNRRIRKIILEKAVATIAGSGSYGIKDGEGKNAVFAYPTGVTVSKKGNIYIADRRNSAIRKIDRRGKVTTVAGGKYHGFKDGIGRDAYFREPVALAVDKDENIYVADSGNHAIRKITPKGEVTTVVGNGYFGFKDGKAQVALLNWPTGIVVDKNGVIYFCDSANNVIRKISKEGFIETIAGNGKAGYKDGKKQEAMFNFPTGIFKDIKGDIYVADSGNNVIRRIYKKEVNREKK